jgi:hypothetical protein
MRTFHTSLVALLALVVTATPAAAYVGPGAGLSAIGAALALLGAIALSVVGFIWYPVKRLLLGRARRRAGAAATATPDGPIS